MCLYKSGNGKIYTDRELNLRGFLIAKQKNPGLSSKQYRAKLAAELGGLEKMPFSTVSELCANGIKGGAGYDRILHPSRKGL